MTLPIVINSGDAEFYLLLSHILASAGYAPALTKNTEETRALAARYARGAVLLDCRRTHLSVVQTCLHLKEDATTSSVPVVALVAPDAEEQLIDLLQAGVDESFVRPLAPGKLLKFLDEQLRGGGLEGDGKGQGIDGIHLIPDLHLVSLNGSEFKLSPIEFRLLQHLLRSEGRVLSREELIAVGWTKKTYVETRTVDVHIGRLRRAITSSGCTDFIRTIRSVGYAIDWDHLSGDRFQRQ